MTDKVLTIGAGKGGLCLLNTKECRRDRVYDAADKIGCGKLVPAQPARTTVLRAAMEEVADSSYGKRRKQPISVRQTADRAAFEAVRVVTHATKNEYVFLFSACIDENWNVSILEYTTDGPYGYVLCAKLDQLVANKRDYLPGPVVSQVVVKMLKDWSAVPLLDNGGAWFLPGMHLDDYRSFARDVHGVGDGPRFGVTTFEIASDPDTVSSVLDRLHAEVTAGMQEIMADVMEATGGMADRSINVRLSRANEFLKKVRLYEAIIGKPLPDLTEAIEQVKQAVAVNRLLSAAV